MKKVIIALMLVVILTTVFAIPAMAQPPLGPGHKGLGCSKYSEHFNTIWVPSPVLEARGTQGPDDNAADLYTRWTPPGQL